MRCKHCDIEIVPCNYGYYHVGKKPWNGKPAQYAYCYVANSFGNPVRTFDTKLIAEPCTKEENVKKILKCFQE